MLFNCLPEVHVDPLHIRPALPVFRFPHPARLKVESSGMCGILSVVVSPKETHRGVGDGFGDDSGALEDRLRGDPLRETVRRHLATVEARERVFGVRVGGPVLREVACRAARVRRAEAVAALVAVRGVTER